MQAGAIAMMESCQVSGLAVEKIEFSKVTTHPLIEYANAERSILAEIQRKSDRASGAYYCM